MEDEILDFKFIMFSKEACDLLDSKANNDIYRQAALANTARFR